MTQVQLLSGSYSSASLTASAQRCVNLFPESNPQNVQPEALFTHRLRPGLVVGVTLDDTPVRGVFTASNGELYAVAGSSVYHITQFSRAQKLGHILPGTTPVRMADNGTSLMIVDGTSFGYQVFLSSNTFSSIGPGNASGPNGYGFRGADWIDYMDTFLFGNVPESDEWFSSLSNSVQFDSLGVATKTGNADFIHATVALRRYIWVIGTQATELWATGGGTQFPFNIVSGPYIEHGSKAKYSIAKLDESVFWLNQDKRGLGIVLEGNGYSATRVSTHAIETEFLTYATLADAEGFGFQWAGHSFYVLRFPTADKTWAYDRITQQWHEIVTCDADMREHQWLGRCASQAYGQIWIGDYSSGNLYNFDVKAGDNGRPIKRLRDFPHIISDLRRIKHQRFAADIEVGTTTGEYQLPIEIHCDGEPASTSAHWQGTANADFPNRLLWDGIVEQAQNTQGLVFDYQNPPITAWQDPVNLQMGFNIPLLDLVWSDTRGRTWGNPVTQSMGRAGEYNKRIVWRRLGKSSDRVYRLIWVTSAVTTLNGAFLDTPQTKQNGE